MEQASWNDADEMPAPSVELVLVAVLVQSYLRQLPRRKRPEFLLDVTEALRSYGDAYEIIRIRPRTEDASMRIKFREANAWWAQILGVLSRMERTE